ncbi:type II secretion system protein [Vibrio sp. RE86]|uniref:type II secretion system protein n=1 Tax=Vibrio sp. RE86 TaxID=2607605 RepID=UPI001493A2B0|nr:type II secretion system protein [Vibrio sp. RE86]NOH78680.1 type II secretion system protein [Vibrio sp. RE86]
MKTNTIINTLLTSLFSLACWSVQANESVMDEQQQVVEELKAMLQAVTEYQQDTGRTLPITPDTDVEYGYLAIDYLIEDPGIEGWNGPYLPYNNDWFGFEQYVSHPDYIAAQLLAKQDTQWSKGSTPEGCDANSESCNVAACIWSVPEEVAKGINKQFDGVLNGGEVDNTGTVRFEGGLVWIVCMTGQSYIYNQD